MKDLSPGILARLIPAAACLFGTGLCFALPAAALRFHYQAKLSDSVSSVQGQHTFFFALYDGGTSASANGGTLLFSETAIAGVSNGIVDCDVGTGTNTFGGSLSTSMFNVNDDVFLQVAVDSATNYILPRTRLDAAPFAIEAADSSKLGGLSASAYNRMQWNSATVDQVVNANNGYITSSTVLVTLTLPSSANVGDVIRISCPGIGGWKLAQNGGQTISTSNLSIPVAQAAFTQRDAARQWQCITSSADGKYLAAGVQNGNIYTSSDYGVTWNPQDSARDWSSIASSADGSHLAACAKTSDRIYVSDNYGATWTARDSNRNWSGIASSVDGGNLIACENGGRLYTSSNFGTSWTAQETSRAWQGVASSADGKRLAACAQGGQVYTSSDYGVSWTPHSTIQSWRSIASSSDGSHLLAAVNGGQLYTSVDYGGAWTARENNRAWVSVTGSTDGNRVGAVASGDFIYTSTNGGVTWTQRDSTGKSWAGIASSYDGARFAACEMGGLLYTSGATPLQQTITGAAGYLAGSPFSSLELQFAGNGVFQPISFTKALGGN